MKQASANWVDLRRDAVSGIEALRAHFTGHAYDPHWHDSYLIGVTEQGVQQFHSRRKQHQSRPGTVFMLEPEELHDGDAINDSGFTYRMLYLSPQQIARHRAPEQADAPSPR
ncbi:AraC family ligand binding domain-containing protein, partial [Pantoea vagans]